MMWFSEYITIKSNESIYILKLTDSLHIQTTRIKKFYIRFQENDPEWYGASIKITDILMIVVTIKY